MRDTLLTKPGIGPGLPLPVVVHMMDGTFGEDATDVVEDGHAVTRDAKTDAWLLATLGDNLARHLEWLIEEPNSGLLPEVLDAVKASAARDVQQFKTAYGQCGFVRQGAGDDGGE